MPADLLVPAFALTLAVNAVLIVLAIRALRTDRRPGPVRSSVPPRGARPAHLPEGHVPQAAPGPIDGAGRIDVTGDADHDPPSPVAATIVEVDGPAATPAEPPFDATHEPIAERPASVPPQPAARASKGAAARTGRRRKFSLPPLEDPDKVSRSIQTFLTAADAPIGPAVPAPVVTVAAIELLGGQSGLVLERTVRATARTTDTVSVDRRGRVRVVLAGTGELAAHAYLRRIRAIVEPVLEADDPTSRVVIATATELDGATATARRRADRRLAVALRAAAADTGRPLDAVEVADDVDELDQPEPRAAGH